MVTEVTSHRSKLTHDHSIQVYSKLGKAGGSVCERYLFTQVGVPMPLRKERQR